LVYGMTKMCYI